MQKKDAIHKGAGYEPEINLAERIQARFEARGAMRI